MGGRGSSSGNRAQAAQNARREREYMAEAVAQQAANREQAEMDSAGFRDDMAQARQRDARERGISLESDRRDELGRAIAESRERAASDDSRRAMAELKAAKAPTRQRPIRIEMADGRYGTISRVRPGYPTGNRTEDTMYTVRIYDADGSQSWWTNRRGSGALRQAKDDVALNLGLRGIGERIR